MSIHKERVNICEREKIVKGVCVFVLELERKRERGREEREGRERGYSEKGVCVCVKIRKREGERKEGKRERERLNKFKSGERGHLLVPLGRKTSIMYSTFLLFFPST